MTADAKFADSKYDVLIYGATPAGIASAVTAAREGLKVVLVNYFQLIGGLLSNGLGVWDTLYEGKRSPVYDEIRQSILDYYKNKYGSNSKEYKDALPGETDHSNGTFEPSVIKTLMEQIVKNEKKLVLVTGYYPINSQIENKIVKSISFKNCQTDKIVKIQAKFVIDCSYEGDLMPILNVPYRIGRESRSEFNEPHAGKIFMRDLHENGYSKRLNLRHFGTNQAIIFPESTGKGDSKVQAFNMRTILTSDPANRIEIKKPTNYDRESVKNLEYDLVINLPNNKICWNRPQLVGIHQKYVEGDWTKRQVVIEAHKKAVISKLYFLQNDKSVPDDVRNYWKKYGLPKDEFVDNDNMPYEIYVREARRLVGESVVTQNDLMPAIGLKRTPLKFDSIGFTDWYMDSHACTLERTRDSLHEGKMMLYYDTYPSQIPFSSLYTKKVRNFLVPVCLSATHVAWGAIRLEPTWISLAESASVAVSMAIEEDRLVDEININMLQIRLVERRIMISFMNHADISSGVDLNIAIQYFSTKGFFDGYNARLEELISEKTAERWIHLSSSIIEYKHMQMPYSNRERNFISADEFNSLLERSGFRDRLDYQEEKLSKAQVLEFLYRVVKTELMKRK